MTACGETCSAGARLLAYLLLQELLQTHTHEPYSLAHMPACAQVAQPPLLAQDNQPICFHRSPSSQRFNPRCLLP